MRRRLRLYMKYIYIMVKRINFEQKKRSTSTSTIWKYMKFMRYTRKIFLTFGQNLFERDHFELNLIGRTLLCVVGFMAQLKQNQIKRSTKQFLNSLVGIYHFLSFFFFFFCKFYIARMLFIVHSPVSHFFALVFLFAVIDFFLSRNIFSILQTYNVANHHLGYKYVYLMLQNWRKVLQFVHVVSRCELTTSEMCIWEKKRKKEWI